MNEQDKILRDAERASTRGDWAQCMISADEALKNDPSCSIAMFQAALALMKMDNDGLALQLFNVCSKLQPDVHAVWHNMGACLHERHPEQAYKVLLKAEAVEKDQAETLFTLSNVASSLGKHEEAVAWAQRYFSIFGHNPDVAHNQSFALMALGRWAEGWKAFRGSLGCADRVTRNYHTGRETPRWSPSVHKDGVVVLYGEQGIGDEILYASMIPAAIACAQERGSRVSIECDERNAGLFARSFKDATVYGTRAQKYVEWVADEKPTQKMEFGGLGEHFAKEPFRRGGFLAADSARREMWRVWLNASNVADGDSAGGVETVGRGSDRRGVSTRPIAPRVGLAWTGGTWATGRARRSVDFEEIRTLARSHPNITFVCLEYEDRREELKDLPNMLNPHWATRKGADFDDMAALVSELDLVISVTTSAVDLCGALGVECWVLADAHPQWRYSDFLGKDAMFFYESVRVFRQREWNAWGPALAQVSRALKERAGVKEGVARVG